MTARRLTFKEMCAKFEVTPRTLRYYEYIELLHPERNGRARYYAPRDVVRMSLIRGGRRFGFSLEEIRQWLLIYETEGNVAQMRALVVHADRQLKILCDQRDEIASSIEDLQRLRDETITRLESESEGQNFDSD